MFTHVAKRTSLPFSTLCFRRTRWEQKRGLAATRTRGLSHVYLGTLSELLDVRKSHVMGTFRSTYNHTTSWMVVRKSSKACLWVELTPQDRAVIAVDENSIER